MKDVVREVFIYIFLVSLPFIILLSLVGWQLTLIITGSAIIIIALLYAVIYLICRSIYEYIKTVKGSDIEMTFRNPIVIKIQKPFLIKSEK